MSFFIRNFHLRNKVINWATLTSLLFVFFFGIPQRSHAQFVVSDPVVEVNTGIVAGAAVTDASLQGSLTAKEFLGDAVANFIAKMIIKQLTAQTVNWINSGFKGNPAYVSNPQQFFLNIGDNIASTFLSSPELNALCTPFNVKVRLALVKNYINIDQQNYSCTIDKVVQNYDNFTRDFTQGGWDGWFSMTQTDTNNPFGSYIKAQNQLSIQIGNKQKTVGDQLLQGAGFLSQKKCIQWADPDTNTKINRLSNNTDPNSPANLQKINLVAFQGTLDAAKAKYATLNKNPNATVVQLNAALAEVNAAQSRLDAYKSANQTDINTDYYNSTQVDLSASNAPDGESEGDINLDGKVCVKSEVVTPGKVIADQLNKAIGSSVDGLIAADEINEIISALMTQLVSRVVGGIGNGLRGASQSSAGQPSLMNQIQTSLQESSKENTDFKSNLLQNTPSQVVPVDKKPIITLNGPSIIILDIGAAFVDPGATVVDAVDGTSQILGSGIVDTNTPTIDGYTLTYTATNTREISATPITRIVIVKEPAPVDPGLITP